VLVAAVPVGPGVLVPRVGDGARNNANGLTGSNGGNGRVAVAVEVDMSCSRMNEGMSELMT
jgi:hypothetical protein